MKKHKTTHEENLDRLARIEGQIRGVRRLVEKGAYCIDIITQIQAICGALRGVGGQILRKHMEHCVADALRSRSRADIENKIEEVMQIVERSGKVGS
jgi:CsoR family transcriptional regulator, copper-sensing transcriptional repressor